MIKELNLSQETVFKRTYKISGNCYVCKFAPSHESLLLECLKSLKVNVFSSLDSVRVAEHFDYRTRCLLRWTVGISSLVWNYTKYTPSYTRIRTLWEKKTSSIVYAYWSRFHKWIGLLHFHQTLQHRRPYTIYDRQRHSLISPSYAMLSASGEIMQSLLKSTQTSRTNVPPWLMRVSLFQINFLPPYIEQTHFCIKKVKSATILRKQPYVGTREGTVNFICKDSLLVYLSIPSAFRK